MEIAITMAIFFVILTAIYIAVTLFLPEWVGITGNKAKEIMKHQEEQPSTDSAVDVTKSATESQALSHDTTKPHQ